MTSAVRQSTASISPPPDQEIIADSAKLKLVAIALSITAIVVSYCFPMIATFCVSGSLLYAAYELNTLANNGLEVIDNAALRETLTESRIGSVNHLTKGAPLARLILQSLPTSMV